MKPSQRGRSVRAGGLKHGIELRENRGASRRAVCGRVRRLRANQAVPGLPPPDAQARDRLHTLRQVAGVRGGGQRPAMSSAGMEPARDGSAISKTRPDSDRACTVTTQVTHPSAIVCARISSDRCDEPSLDAPSDNQACPEFLEPYGKLIAVAGATARSPRGLAQYGYDAMARRRALAAMSEICTCVAAATPVTARPTSAPPAVYTCVDLRRSTKPIGLQHPTNADD